MGGGEALVEELCESGEGFVDVEREPEAAAGLERGEPVQGGADDAGGVNRVVRLEVVAAQHGEDDVDRLRSRGAGFRVVGIGRPLQRRVAARVLAGVASVGVGHGRKRVAAGAARGRRLHRGSEPAGAASREPPPQIGKPLDVRVERGRAHAKPAGKGRQRERFEPLGVRELFGSTDNSLAVEAGARHQPCTAASAAGRDRLARAIARSIAARGLRCAGPCPTTSSGGSSARSFWADSTSFARSQVAIAANGKRR